MESSRQYLNDTKLGQQLAEEGFVVIPFLSEEEVSLLKKAFEEAHPEQPAPFYATAHHQDSEFRKKMSAVISKVIEPFCQDVFNE